MAVSNRTLGVIGREAGAPAATTPDDKVVPGGGMGTEDKVDDKGAGTATVLVGGGGASVGGTGSGAVGTDTATSAADGSDVSG